MTKIKDLLEYSLQSGASDLHLSVGSIPMVRIHGEMKKLQLPILDPKNMDSIRDDILKNSPKDNKITLDLNFIKITSKKFEKKYEGKIRNLNFYQALLFHLML